METTVSTPSPARPSPPTQAQPQMTPQMQQMLMRRRMMQMMQQRQMQPQMGMQDMGRTMSPYGPPRNTGIMGNAVQGMYGRPMPAQQMRPQYPTTAAPAPSAPKK